MATISKNIIPRAAADRLRDHLEPKKVVVVYGPRRVGKTTLLQKIATEYANREKILSVSGEDVSIHEPLSSRTAAKLDGFVGDASLLIIDEAQLIPDIGRNLKLLVDTHDNLKIIASGSASFDLAKKIGEPLVGRKWTIMLYPFWMQELVNHAGNWFSVHQTVETLLIYGSYPEVIQATGYRAKQEILTEIANSYLYKDILALESVRKPKSIRNLLELLAYQIGHEVSLTELSNTLGIDRETIARYLYLLEEAFVIVNIRGFSRNLRKEITKTSRYYFYDTGIRNALIKNFNSLELRPDVGALWENWLVMERLKKQHYTGLLANNYFWRTYDQKELDWVEDRGGKLWGYEFKWRPAKKARGAKLFTATYPNSEVATIHPDNYQDFVL